MIASRQARHRDAAAAMITVMRDAVAPIQAMARARGLDAALEPSTKAFTTARLVIAPDAADDVSLVISVNDASLVTSMSLAITAEAIVYFGAAHRVTGAHGEDYFLWHSEREMALAAGQAARLVSELRELLDANFDAAVAALVERAGS
jgi:hypothetical protein